MSSGRMQHDTPNASVSWSSWLLPEIADSSASTRENPKLDPTVKFRGSQVNESGGRLQAPARS